MVEEINFVRYFIDIELLFGVEDSDVFGCGEMNLNGDFVFVLEGIFKVGVGVMV